MFAFILGALSGSFATWWWRSDIQQYVDQKYPQVRVKAADRLAALERRAEDALGKARHKIDRMRSGVEHHAHDVTSTRPSGSYTSGTGTGTGV
jgi:hypothetical protein